MRCVACNKELSKKEVLFTENKEPYCVNPFTCNDEHPNSVKKILARGAAVKMFTEDELEENIFDKLSVSDEMKERIMKVAGKPQSIRLSKLDIAHYLVQLQDSKELASISEAVRYCVNVAMKELPVAELLAPKPSVPEQPKGEPTPHEDEVQPQRVDKIEEETVNNPDTFDTFTF